MAAGIERKGSRVTKPAKKNLFEENMARLEAIVVELERPNLPLNEALALYEEGVGLIKTCQKTLLEAEQKVLLLGEASHG